MDLTEIWAGIVSRLAPLPDGFVPGRWVLLALAAAGLAVAVPMVWRYARIAVTIVHELGHAGVGMLLGRRFTGFVVSGDMSGQAVTVGPTRGIGRVLSAWAGYPMPALIGALLVLLSLSPWPRTSLGVACAVLVVCLVFARSWHTVAALLVTAIVCGGVFWLGSASVCAALTLGAGVFLLLGAWRHLGTVMRSGRRQDDPQQLAQLTGVPAALWNLSYVIVLAGCTYWAGRLLAPLVLPGS